MNIYLRRKFNEEEWEQVFLSDIILEEEFNEVWEGVLNNSEILYTENYIYKSNSAEEPTLKYKNSDIGKETILIGSNNEGWEEITLLEAKETLKGYGEYLSIRLLNGDIVKYPNGEVKLLGTEKCPNCGVGYLDGSGALSRKDNETQLCSECGEKEAMEELEMGHYQ